MEHPSSAENLPGDVCRASRHGLRILVADDDPDTTEAMCLLLKCWGYTVLWTARDGPTALALAEANEPDLILLDIGLPQLDGWTLVRQLRNGPRGQRPFVIALTGYGMAEDYAHSARAGVNMHLVKPVDPNKLKESLARLQ
jgi:CheY-like chemotaxis protein